MDEKAAVMGPTMPLLALLPIVVLMLAALIYVAGRSRSRPAGFLIVAIGIRPLLSSMHTLTFSASPVGLSWNALGSIAVVAWGTLIIRRRPSVARFSAVIAPLVIVALVSGITNHREPALASFIVKYAYLAILALIAVEAADDIGPGKLCRFLILPLAIPLVMQLCALPFGVVKSGELDGSSSYIGGFYHEAAFSTLLLGTMLVVAFADVGGRAKTLLVLWCIAGIFAANYRTALLAVLPLLAALIIFGLPQKFVANQRALVRGTIILVTATVGIGIALTQEERFADVGVAFTEGTGLIKRPELFNVADRHVMSARPLIWSQYIYAWKDAGEAQRWIGLGPEAWIGVMNVYAHNTLVSALYEIGIFGLLAVIILWLGMFIIALWTPRDVRPLLLACHISFFVLNMATMPMWMIEGMIYYGVLCGLTLYYAAVAKVARSNASSRMGAGAYRTPVLNTRSKLSL